MILNKFCSKIDCPCCRKTLIDLQPYKNRRSLFWCEDCELEIIVKNLEDKKNEKADNNDYDICANFRQ